MSLFRKLLGRAGTSPAATPPAARPEGWFRRLSQGLSRSSETLGAGIAGIFTKRRLDAETVSELEDILIAADLGPAAAAKLASAVAQDRYDREIGPQEVRTLLASEIEAVLAPVEKPLVFDDARRPFVILVVGVNGSGKTTTIGKLGALARAEGYSVMLAACDTFRAAAIDQLRVWGERIGADVMARPPGSDAAGLAFDALELARQKDTDVLIVDTAGRLQNKADLMGELEKIIRVLRKVEPTAPHATLLVLDATTGQNALGQVDVFMRIAGVTGLVMTKLDGTARGGILVAMAERFGLPVHAIGVGEHVEDLQPFEARAFARAIVGLEDDGKAQ